MATNPPITIGELTTVPAPGSGVNSPWAQQVSSRVVQRFATLAAANAATGLTDGMLCEVTATKRFYIRDGGAWLPYSAYTAAGRLGFSGLVAGAPVLTTAVVAVIPWTDVYDPDAMCPGTNVITVPVSGLWTINYGLVLTASATDLRAMLNVTGMPPMNFTGVPAALDTAIATITHAMAAGDTITTRAFQASGANRTVAATTFVEVWRVGT